MQTDEALYAELDSQAASYASDLQLQLRGSSTYGGRANSPTDHDDDYHELDAARLHRRYGGGSGRENGSENGTLKKDPLRTRHSQRYKVIH